MNLTVFKARNDVQIVFDRNIRGASLHANFGHADKSTVLAAAAVGVES